jgi:hypothetical protein
MKFRIYALLASAAFLLASDLDSIAETDKPG